MVNMRQAAAVGRQYVQGYGPSGFRISGVLFEGAVLVRPDRAAPLAVTLAADLTAAHLEVLAQGDQPTEVLLVGCGARAAALPPALVTGLALAGVGVEAMDSGAAARTYNVLMMEDRRVAAVLLPIT